MTETIKLDWSDICRHEPRCECKEWLCHTVPNYGTYCQATHWLREERKYKLVYTSGETYDDNVGGKIHTGRFTFKFLCEQEYMWFKLRWS